MRLRVRAPSARSSAERERFAEELLDRLTPLMSVLGVLFLLLVVGERLARPDTLLAAVLGWCGWLLWAVFAAEFVLRLVVAPDTAAFLRRNWWQAVFLALPFLRVLRLLRAVRALRAGRVLSSTIRSTRSAHRMLGDRVGWLVALTAITVLAASQLLYEFAHFQRYGDALHAAALGAITGEPLGRGGAFAGVMEIVLALYSVVVFAALAGTIGAFFVQREPAPESQPVQRHPGASSGYQP